MNDKNLSPLEDYELIYHGDRYGSQPAGVACHRRAVTNVRGAFALKLMEHFSLVAAKEAGEDSSGRAKVRLANPEEIVRHCCEVSDLAFSELESREWYVPFPEYKVVERMALKAAKEREKLQKTA